MADPAQNDQTMPATAFDMRSDKEKEEAPTLAADEGDSVEQKVAKPKDEEDLTPLGNWKRIKKLGQGGMGTVYKAQHKTLESRIVALKTLSPELARKPNFVERFLREARAMDKLKHPNVVDVMDVDESNGVYYIALEFIDGKSMEDWIGELGQPLTLGDSLKVILDCANALKHAHEVGIIHRDMKPDNILITSTGIVKVADFGLAKAMDEDQSVTQTGAGLGTPLYMAPEQARNAKYVDHRTDIYALGCTFYYMLMGKHAFKGDSVVEIITKKEKGDYKPVRGHRDSVDLVIAKMIDPKPDRRHKDYDDLIKELLSACGQPNETLSFIDGAVASPQAPAAPGAPTSAQMAQTKPTAAAASKSAVNKTKASGSKSQAKTKATGSSSAATKQKAWLVRFKTKQGKETVQKMTTDKIRKGIAAGMIGIDATGTTSKKQPFKSLGEFPEFAGMMRSQKAKNQEDSKRKKMQDVIAAADKDVQRKRRWKWLRNLKESTLGYFGFVLYLGVIAGVGYGLYLGLPIVWKWAATMLGFDN